MTVKKYKQIEIPSVNRISVVLKKDGKVYYNHEVNVIKKGNRVQDLKNLLL